MADPTLEQRRQAALDAARRRIEERTARNSPENIATEAQRYSRAAATQGIGLAMRAGVQAIPSAVGGLPALAADAYDSMVNATRMGYNAAVPENKQVGLVPPFRASQGLAAFGEKWADALNLPKPQTTMQRGLTNIGSAALSAVGGAGVVSSIGQGVPAASRAGMAIEQLSSTPVLQGLGAAGGVVGTELAQSLGVTNPAALALIGMTGGATTGTVGTLAGRGVAGVRQAAAPFTTLGRERLVGEALNRVATNPTQAAENLANSRVLVPGSNPMVHEVSRDAGLINAYSAVRGFDENGLIPARLSEQNSARMSQLDRIARDQDTLAAATAKRDSTYEAIGAPVLDNAAPINIGGEWINNSILRRIREIRETPAGARQTVREALDEAESYITQEGVDLTDARVLYEIRKDLDLLRTGKLSGAGKSGRERSNMQVAENQLSEIIRSIDDAIESGAPGYRDYMQMYAKRSIPLDQLKALQSLRSKAVLSAPDPLTDDPVLSQSKFTTLLRNNMVADAEHTGNGPGAATLRQTVPGTNERVLADLSPQHLRVLDLVAQDLDRGAAATAGTMRTPNSDTFKNLSVAAIIGRVLGDKTGQFVSQSTAGKTLTAPLNFLYRIPERDVQLLMLEAWRDPRLAARLMQGATNARVEEIGKELARRAQQQATASAIYGQP